MRRAFWFAVGTGAGVYGTVKARRIAYRLSPEGLADQAAAVGLGLRALVADVRDGMAEREELLLDQPGLPHLGRHPDQHQDWDGHRDAPDAAGRRPVPGARHPSGLVPALAARSPGTGDPARRDTP